MKNKSTKCSTLYCRNEREKGRTICSKCSKRKQRKKFPMKYAFYDLKTNAKRRGKEFNLTFDEFKKFCKETGYMDGKGKSSNSFSIDRKDPSKGYSYENIQILTLSENTKKQRNKELQEVFGEFLNDCPF